MAKSPITAGGDKGSKSFAATEFSDIPFDVFVAGPLTAAVAAQGKAAIATRDFITGLMVVDETDKTRFKPQTVDFLLNYKSGNNDVQLSLDVPLLAIVPIPHLRIDSITSHFTYQVSQVLADTKSLNGNLEAKGGTQGLLSQFVNVSLSGSLTSASSHEARTNRSGAIEVTVHASEAPIPEGLSRLLSLLARAVPEPQVTPVPTT